MIFIYLFIISIVGIIVAFTIEHKKTKKSLLQILKTSCSIDSVQFERQLDTAQQKTYTLKKYIYSITHISSKKAFECKSIVIKKIKFFIRKRLHSDKKDVAPSEFISKISSR